MRIFVVGIAALGTLMLTAPVAPAGFDAGKAAFEREDYAAARRDLEPLAAQGNVEAQYMMGAIRGGGRGDLRDYQAAASWYAKAAAQGHRLSAFSLGFLYYYGAGTGASAVRAEPARAAKWLLQAAGQGVAMAQYLVGKLYAEGRGLPTDAQEAFRWMHAAAHNGIAGAQFDVALRYAKGVTVPRDRLEAYKWFWLLAGDRYPGAEQNRDTLARSLSDAERARAEAAGRAWRTSFLGRPDVGPHGERSLGQ